MKNSSILQENLKRAVRNVKKIDVFGEVLPIWSYLCVTKHDHINV